MGVPVDSPTICEPFPKEPRLFIEIYFVVTMVVNILQLIAIWITVREVSWILLTVLVRKVISNLRGVLVIGGYGSNLSVTEHVFRKVVPDFELLMPNLLVNSSMTDGEQNSFSGEGVIVFSGISLMITLGIGDFLVYLSVFV